MVVGGPSGRREPSGDSTTICRNAGMARVARSRFATSVSHSGLSSSHAMAMMVARSVGSFSMCQAKASASCMKLPIVVTLRCSDLSSIYAPPNFCRFGACRQRRRSRRFVQMAERSSAVRHRPRGQGGLHPRRSSLASARERSDRRVRAGARVGAPRTDTQVRGADRARRSLVLRARRAGRGLPGPQRRRQDDHHASGLRLDRPRRRFRPVERRARRRAGPSPLRVHARRARPLPGHARRRAAPVPRPAARDERPRLAGRDEELVGAARHRRPGRRARSRRSRTATNSASSSRPRWCTTRS